MPGRDIVVVGASAGGVETLMNLVRGLPAGLPAAIFVVLHLPAGGSSYLPAILSRAGPLPATHAEDGEEVRPGHVFIAPPDRHLLLKPGHVVLLHGPRENGHRPAIDPLFRSAAHAYGRRVMGVVLSGTLDDGTAGLASIKQHGGLALVQDPREALFPGMPASALETVEVDYCLPVADLASLIVRLASEPVSEEEPAVAKDPPPPDPVELEMAGQDNPEISGPASGFVCPECSGALWETSNREVIRYRCRVGHAYTVESLLSAHSDALEAALWIAVRALEERSQLTRRLARRAAAAGQSHAHARFRQRAEEAEQHAAVIRGVLNQRNSTEGEAASTDAVWNTGTAEA